MQNTLTQYGPLVARILLSALFIVAGVNKALDFSGTVGFIESLGMPIPMVLTVIVIAVEVLGGLSVLIGFKARTGAAVLGLFSIVSAVVVHAEFPEQTTAFLKNMALAGGYLYLVIHGAGPLSVDEKFCRKCEAENAGNAGMPDNTPQV